MSAKNRADEAAEKLASARSNPYVQRLLEDAELRNNARAAFAHARSAYGRLNNGKAPTQAIQDKKLHGDLRAAAEALRSAGESLKAAPAAPKRKRRGRTLVLLIVSAGAAVALSEGLRTKVLDALFGKEEQFDYTSTTTPATAPDPAPAEPAEPAAKKS
jgi:hypothetical protein